MNTPTIGTRTPDPDRLVSFHATCDLLGKSPRSIKRMIRAGKIKPAMIGRGRVAFWKSELSSLVEPQQHFAPKNN